jgi:uncharacterized protein (TIGR00304 family)
MNPLVAFGIILILTGFFLIWREMFRQAIEKPYTSDNLSATQKFEPTTTVKGGGIIMIGPIPIIFGSDKKHAVILAILTIIIMLLALLYWSSIA